MGTRTRGSCLRQSRHAGRDNMLRVSVVIPAFNRCAVTGLCLEALGSQDLPPEEYEVIVVDDASSDDTPEVVRSFQERARCHVTYIRHTVNKGHTATRNDGVLQARADVVVELDNDNIAAPGMLRAHLVSHEAAEPEHIAVVGNVRYSASSIEGSNFGRYLQSRYLDSRAYDHRINPQDLASQYFAGANHSCRRVDLVGVSLYSMDIQGYGGWDGYLGYRLRQAGVRIVFAANARSEHIDDVSIGRYKCKIIEASAGAFQTLMSNMPGYYTGSRMALLEPIGLHSDTMRMLLAKAAVRVVLNPVTTLLLETWVRTTDKVSFLYLPCVFRALVAGWSLSGLRSKKGKRRLVDYV